MRSREHVPVPVPYFHGEISEAAASELLLRDSGAEDEGKFLVWREGESHHSVVVSVVHDGRPVHHVASRDNEGDEFTIQQVGPCLLFALWLPRFVLRGSPGFSSFSL
jgi:hypothetical protein